MGYGRTGKKRVVGVGSGAEKKQNNNPTTTQKTKTVRHEHLLTRCCGERKELEVGHCVSGLLKKQRKKIESKQQSGGEGKTSRESCWWKEASSQFAGWKPAVTNLQ